MLYFNLFKHLTYQNNVINYNRYKHLLLFLRFAQVTGRKILIFPSLNQGVIRLDEKIILFFNEFSNICL